MIISKELNLSIFQFFNQTFGQAKYDKILGILDIIAYPKHSYFYLYFLSIFIIISIFIYSKKSDKDALKEAVIYSFITMLTLIVTYIISFTIIDSIKLYAGVARPYCSLSDIYVLHHITSPHICYQSFPSGHTAFSTILVISFWPLFNRFFKALAIIFLCVVMISRMASGVHFPMDLVGALAICLPLTLYLRKQITKMIIFYESRFNIFSRVFK